MNWIKTEIEKIMVGLQDAIRDDVTRKEIMFEWLNILLTLVSFFMTIVNIFTKEYTLMISTFVFAVACIINVVIIKRSVKIGEILYVIFVGETFVLLAFFLVSGIPNGFSALWVCLIPSFSLLIFGRKSGTIYSGLGLLMILYFFWFPVGKELLWYRYTDEFMLRFPFFFVACYLLAFFVEIIRAQTQKQLLESEQKFRHLYRLDALTGLYNRYGFDVVLEEDYKNLRPGKVALMMIDIDDFKNVNDQYGHSNGDVVLKGIADILRQNVCKKARYCRWGGEEFTVYLHCEHDYLETAQKIRRSVEEAKFIGDDTVIQVTISVGICIAESMETADLPTLIKLADECLYMAKGKGKNCVVSREISFQGCKNNKNIVS